MEIEGKTYKKWCLLCLVTLLLTVSLPSAVMADYIRIKGTVVNVRQGPGTSHPVLFQAEEGEEFDLLSTEGLWCNIKLPSGQEAWVFRKLVDIIEGTMPGLSPGEEELEEPPPADPRMSWRVRLALTATAILLAVAALVKRKQLAKYTGSRLREISGYKREQAFRYDNRKPSDDSWEI